MMTEAPASRIKLKKMEGSQSSTRAVESRKEWGGDDISSKFVHLRGDS